MSHEFVDQMLEKSQAGELRSPVSETLGMHLVQFGRGEAVYEMEASEQLGNPLGVIQGGVATALADAAMAAATTTIVDDEEIQKSAITTIDIFARFIRPVNVLRQVAVYAGLPSAWNALATMRQTLEGFSVDGSEGRAD
jgi:uncharacterized protein (TIGR00369 family)